MICYLKVLSSTAQWIYQAEQKGQEGKTENDFFLLFISSSWYLGEGLKFVWVVLRFYGQRMHGCRNSETHKSPGRPRGLEGI